MNLSAKGRIIEQSGDMATINLSSEELGRAVLSYVVNNSESGIGEKFMRNLFSGKPLSINDMIMENVVEAKKKSEIDGSQPLLKMETKADNSTVGANIDNESKLVDEVDSDILEDNAEKIELLKDAGSAQKKITELECLCPSLYKKIVNGNQRHSSQVFANCEIIYVFGEIGVTYSFISYKNKNGNTITPNNNLVFKWEESTSEYLDELISLC